MGKSIYKTFVFLLLSILILSCSRSIYTPTTPNIPLIQNKYEFQFESTIATNGLNIKTAFSPLNHFSLQLNGQYTYSSKYSEPQYHEYIEGAIGSYFKPNDQLLIEMYLGYGAGASNYGDAGSFSVHRLTLAKGHYRKEYFQFNIGTPISKHRGSLGGCIRIGNVSYTYESSRIANLTGNTYNHLTIEPYMFLKIYAIREIGFVTYFGFTFVEGIDKTIRTNALNFGIGLNLRLGIKTEK
jgi:hypothetical protein